MKDFKENAHISLVNNQRSGDETEKIEFISCGNFYKRDGVFHITYKEHSEMGMGDSRVFLKVEQSRITMRRMGEFRTEMIYEVGRLTDFVYRMPFGEMNIKIRTDKLSNNLTEDGGELDFSYALIMNGDEIYNDIRIRITTERTDNYEEK